MKRNILGPSVFSVIFLAADVGAAFGGWLMDTGLWSLLVPFTLLSAGFAVCATVGAAIDAR